MVAPSGAVTPWDPSHPSEQAACTPRPTNSSGFNVGAILPYGLAIQHVQQAMDDFVNFLRLINLQLNSNGLSRLECLIMQANFSSIVGEFISFRIPHICNSLVKNKYHNGYPDLIPKGLFQSNSTHHAPNTGIEIKASRYMTGWQGHNPEDGWLIVFVYQGNRPNDVNVLPIPRPFEFVAVYGAQLTKDDWTFAGRSATSRRTITASVNASGRAKLAANPIYLKPDR